jgi:uncharacterized protein YceK
MLATTGCGTLFRGEANGIYPATRYDAIIIFVGASPSSILSEAQGNVAEIAAFRSAFMVAGLADLPISLVSDTLCLPYDLAKPADPALGPEPELAPLEQFRR